MNPLKKGSGGKRRLKKNQFMTKSGSVIKVHQSLTERIRSKRDARAKARAAYLSTLPKNRFKRILYRLHPKRVAKYWFSREGGIMALKLLGIGIVTGFLLLIGLFAYFRKDLPNLKDISGNNIGGSIQYYDKSGQTLLWEDFDAVKRIPVHDDQINKYVRDATVAVEDKDFFQHGGFDVRGIMRAAWNNAFGGSTQGGSTITQQLVRLTQSGVGKDQTYSRKVKELILSVELERSYSKEEILTGYLNTAPYGNVQYGVESATRDYFEKSAKDLTLDEAAFLAAIPKSPSYYSPYGPNYNPEAIVGREHYILDLMEQQGKITKEQRDEAKAVDTLAKVKQPKQKYAGIKAPWFVLTAKENLEEKFGAETVQRGGWKVTTTLDLNLQGIAEEQVNKGMAQVRKQGGDTAAFVAEDVKTGQVVALVGGSDFNNTDFGQNNYARIKLPPGSSFKPYDYVSLLESSENFGAGSVLYDTQGALEGYPCTNKAAPKNGGNCLHDYDLRYPGPITLRYALGGSRNVPAVKAMLLAGVDKTIETAEKLGLESGYKCYEDDALTVTTQCYASLNSTNTFMPMPLFLEMALTCLVLTF
jgi:membrane peptidoglycan carboxypeptidase